MPISKEVTVHIELECTNCGWRGSRTETLPEIKYKELIEASKSVCMNCKKKYFKIRDYYIISSHLTIDKDKLCVVIKNGDRVRTKRVLGEIDCAGNLQLNISGIESNVIRSIQIVGRNDTIINISNNNGIIKGV